MSRNIAKKLLRIFLWAILGLVLLLIAIPVLLYVPFVQDFAVRIATEQVSKSTGMKIEVGRMRLGFPLKLKVDDATVIQANGDTMLTSAHLAVDVKLSPLFKGNIEIGGAELDSVFYQLGNNDSIMWLRANISRADINATDIILKDGNIDLTTVNIDGVRVKLRMLEDSTATPVDTAQGTPWNVKADRITITDLTYDMSMQPMIDSLGCSVDRMELRNGHFDMATKRIYGQSLHVDSVSAAYIYPLVTETVPVAADTVVTPESEMWTITADTLRLTAREGLYAQKDVKPLPGFDPSYIAVSNVSIEVDSFYNKGTSIRVPLKELSGLERSGLQLHADGLFEMDSNAMSAKDFSIETLRSSLLVNASMGMGDLMSDPNLPLMLKASGLIDPAEIAIAFPDMKSMLKPLTPISVSADIEGTPKLLNVYTFDVRMPGLAHVALEGEVSDAFDPDKIGGQLSLDGNLSTITDKQFAFLPIKKVPALAVNGTVDYYPGKVAGDLVLTTGGGRLAGAGRWVAKAESYNATLNLRNFPVDAFVPEYGVERLTASLTVDGRGYNPLSKNTTIDANVKLDSIRYNKETYRDIVLNTTLHDGNAKGALDSYNHDADASARFDASIDGDSVRWDLTTNVRNINLQALGLSPTVNRGSLDLSTSGYYNVVSSDIDAKADVSNLTWNLPELDIVSPQPVNLTLVSADSVLDGSLINGDMNVKLHSQQTLFPFINGLTSGMKEAVTQMDSMRIDVDRLHQALPPFDMLFEMGQNNLAAKFLSESSAIDMKKVIGGVHNDSLLWLNTQIYRFATGTTRIDTITFNAIQHGLYLVYKADINNRPGTFDDFAHVALNGFVGTNRFSAYMKQQNIKGENGFNLGLTALLVDSVVTVKIVPTKPTIAYKPWTINKDNFISYNLGTRHLEASLALHGDNSFIKIFTEHPAGVDSVGMTNDSILKYDDLIVQISDVHLQDWLAINPFAPPIKGDLNADMRISYDAGVLTGKGSVGLKDLFYGRDRVGDFDLAVDVANNPGGKLMADVSLMVDSIKTITAHGVLNDSTAGNPFLLDFRMIKFPLRVVNPFIPQGMAKLSGMLNGEMEITGNMAHPVFNGFIDFDTTEVKVTMLGTPFRFSDEKIPVDSGIVSFNDFAVTGCNENPLYVNGTVNARNLANLGLDLTLKANNIQIVNSNRAKNGSEVYGKAFLDIDASAKGDMTRLDVNADLSVLTGTNVTYVVTESVQNLSSQTDEDMVHFVQFNDTSVVVKADSLVTPSMSLDLEAHLHLMEGAIFNVDLSANGSNKAQIMPQGNVTFSMSELNGERMTGRININSGFVRYTPPFMSEKNFAFQEGSYISFNGDMMNPTLNIHAIDVIKANVTQEGQNSRLVNFDVSLAITNTLANMNVAFDLSTDDDITVQNELSSMSAEQRANQAMNMLLYNVYSGAGTKGNANLSGNQLYSFLTSRLNSWAANNIRGVDISFGIDQYDQTYGGNTSTTTSYSYRVSKSFFNDRFKIIVGGNYTDSDADENFSQNLINDISFEYLLNKSGSMYVRIFRHTGYESILEGEITQTGVGFVLKRKINSLWELFGIRRD